MYNTYLLSSNFVPIFVNMGIGVRETVDLFNYKSGKSQGRIREFLVCALGMNPIRSTISVK